MINWEHLRYLIDNVPLEFDKTKKRESIPPALREKLMNDDNGVCYVCESEYLYGSNNPYLMQEGEKPDMKQCQLHHILPNGESSRENLVTLCIRCHQMVHMLLFIDKRWKYRKPL
jgi:5-methylcytosine-specific restriction endonuclease McrA